ncbi:hypothetical protein [Luteolibacter sp. Populi]
MMDLKNGWHSPTEPHWLHSDLKNSALTYTLPLWLKLVEVGELK